MYLYISTQDFPYSTLIIRKGFIDVATKFTHRVIRTEFLDSDMLVIAVPGIKGYCVSIVNLLPVQILSLTKELS